jgi:hypothetical protein
MSTVSTYLRALPAAEYTVSLELSDFQSSTRDSVVVNVGGITEINATMSLAALATVQYSHKKQARRNNGGNSTNILDSPFLTRQIAPPYFTLR